MMVGSGDVENPTAPAGADTSTQSNPYNTAAGVTNKKWKLIALSTFLIAAVALAIALGVTLGPKGGDGVDTSSQNNNDGTINDAVQTAADNETSIVSNGTIDTAISNETEIGSNGTMETNKVTDPAQPGFEVQYLESVGPIAARVRIANPGVANGYNSCLDLKDDILNALKFHANSIIVSERDKGYFDMCDYGDSCIRDGGCRSGNCVEGKCAAWDPGSPSFSPTSGATPTVGYSLEGYDDDAGGGAGDSAPAPPEDSYDTNTQVDGVDEADAVKANADYVFAAYGDVLWTWNSTDASEGKMSMTQMPQEPRHPNCTDAPTWAPREDSTPFPSPASAPKIPTTPSPEIVSPPTTPFPTEKDAQPGGRNLRQRELSSPSWFDCNKPKRQILSLLLAGPRLTAIVSEPRYYWANSEGLEPIISGDKVVVRVYDAENIPTDGGPLTLLGEQEVKGLYTSARSIGSKGVVISQSNIRTWQLVGDLYRYNKQYCGLNSTEYEKMATETALSMLGPMAEQMVDELALQLDGTCDNFFQIAAMQSGNNTGVPAYDFLGQLVRVTSFDMSSDFASMSSDRPPGIPVDAAGTFASGYSQTVYASEDFVASVNVGYEYNQTSGEWDSATFIQGFDISSVTPKPFSYAELSGAPLNQYSLDLYQNHLRVVTTKSQGWWPERVTTNKLWVLKVPERGHDVAMTSPEMELTGETGHLGKPGEEVFAVRFMGDLAYVVTFEQTDPFYVLNVTDHTNPIVIGELQIPGFSSYLHPIKIDGVSMMIGVGRHVDPVSGSNDGAKISLFDVSDPTNPTENATFIDMGAYSSAGNDQYSFRYLNLNQKLILPKSKWTWRSEGNFDGFVVYDVKLGNITSSYEIQHADSYDIYSGCWYEARMPARSLVFQSQLTTILSHSVISTNLGTGAQNWNVSLDEGLNKTKCEGYFY